VAIGALRSYTCAMPFSWGPLSIGAHYPQIIPWMPSLLSPSRPPPPPSPPPMSYLPSPQRYGFLIKPMLEQIERIKRIIAEQSRDQLFREVNAAMPGMAGHWFECPNGHLYVIGDCGLV